MEFADDRLDALEARIGYNFKDRKWLKAALTHPAWINENRRAAQSGAENDYERLEFLGDALIGRSIAVALFEEEGSSLTPEAMTKLRSALVDQRNCLRIGNELQLEPLIRMGKGLASNASNRDSIIADCVEALVGAVQQDGGSQPAEQVVQKLFLVEGFLNNAQKVHDSKDLFPKFLIFYQEKAKTTCPKPDFRELNEAPAAPPFDWEAKWSREIMETIGVPESVTGTGKSQKSAKHDLADKALRLVAQYAPSSETSHHSQSSKVFDESPTKALLEKNIINPTSTFMELYNKRFQRNCPRDIVKYGFHGNKTMAILSLADFHFEQKEICAVGACKKDAKHAAFGWALLRYEGQL